MLRGKEDFEIDLHEFAHRRSESVPTDTLRGHKRIAGTDQAYQGLPAAGQAHIKVFEDPFVSIARDMRHRKS